MVYIDNVRLEYYCGDLLTFIIWLFGGFFLNRTYLYLVGSPTFLIWTERILNFNFYVKKARERERIKEGERAIFKKKVGIVDITVHNRTQRSKRRAAKKQIHKKWNMSLESRLNTFAHVNSATIARKNE